MVDIANAIYFPNGGTMIGQWPEFTMVGALLAAGESQYILEFARAGRLSCKWSYKTVHSQEYAGYRVNEVSTDLARPGDANREGELVLDLSQGQVIAFYLFSQATPPTPPSFRIDDVTFTPA